MMQFETQPDPSSTQTPPAAHPGAGGMKSRIRASLFGGQAPRRVGRFTIERPLGSGGMGTVYLARDEELERDVALKLVRYDRVSPLAQERLRREAMALAKLAHPNVVPVFEVGEHDGLLFVAMEYVEGQSLRAWLLAEARDWEAVLRVFEQAAEGLAAAHRAGLVHRDFKPENVLVGGDGRVRVVDFGLVAQEGEQRCVAEAIEAMEAAGEHFADADLTRTGEFVGTPAYMAPEQFLGEAPTAASDQFSFFVTLYEALLARRPFPGANVPEMMRAVLEGELRPIDARALPAELRRSLRRGLARDPGERFADMQAVRATLDRVRNPGHLRGSQRWLAAAAMVGFAGLGAASLLVLSPPPEEEPLTEPAAIEAQARIEARQSATEAFAELLAAREDAQRQALAEAYLDAHRESGGVERQLIAAATLGEILWRQSCAEDLDGLCVELRPEPELATDADAPEPCAKPEWGTVERRDRDAELSKSALEHLRLANRLAAAAGELEDEGEQQALHWAMGAAASLLADAELEPYLELHAPRGLDFSDDEDHRQLSKDAFASYYAHKAQAGLAMTTAYREVKDAGSDEWTARAAARTYLVFVNFEDTLLAIPAPRSFDDEQREAYCDVLYAQTEPLGAQASAARDYCRERVEQAGLDAKLCELPSKP